MVYSFNSIEHQANMVPPRLTRGVDAPQSADTSPQSKTYLCLVSGEQIEEQAGS